ncbi:unnamed protein product [Peniophora sp. CBMAI 1063]|nr:unnamed protein product [Peniophora sp. CBMAI 1063]
MTTTTTAACSSPPEGFFVGRDGKLVIKGRDQYTAYGVRRGRNGTRVVRSHTAMLAEISGVSNAVGRGFDSVLEAQEWCDEFILRENPARIAALRAEVDALVAELLGARSRM